VLDPRSLLITPADLPANHRPGTPEAPADGAEGRPASRAPGSWKDVPWRTILASVFVVLATIILVAVVMAAIRIITWVIVAGFFAVVLSPAVRRLEARLGGRRALATTVVVTTALAVTIGFLALFIVPIRSQLVAIVTDLPGTVQDAANGRGAVGTLVDRLGLVGYVQDHQRELEDAGDRLTGSPFELAQRAMGWIITLVTVILLTILMLSQSASLGRGAIGLVPFRHRESVRRAAADAADAVSGYMIGNLLISLIAGTTAFIFLVIVGVPNALVLALLVAFTDLLPLIGATIGAAVCTIAAASYEPRTGLIALAFFVIYQQVENYAIYPSVMSRRVKVNPLVVLVSVLAGVELFGILGALLAVPVSGALLVTVKAARQEFSRDRLVLPTSFDGAAT
jgi:predicted PurR-regulated permease PerM